MKKSIKMLGKFIQSNPQTSILIVSLIVAVPLAVMFTRQLPNSLFDVVVGALVVLIFVGGSIWRLLGKIFIQKTASRKTIEQRNEERIRGIQVIRNGEEVVEELVTEY